MGTPYTLDHLVRYAETAALPVSTIRLHPIDDWDAKDVHQRLGQPTDSADGRLPRPGGDDQRRTTILPTPDDGEHRLRARAPRP